MNDSFQKMTTVYGDVMKKEEVKSLITTAGNIQYDEAKDIFTTTDEIVFYDAGQLEANPLNDGAVHSALHKYMFGDVSVDVSVMFFHFALHDGRVLFNTSDSVTLRYASFNGLSGTLSVRIQSKQQSALLLMLNSGLVAVSSSGKFIAMKFIHEQQILPFYHAAKLQRNLENLLCTDLNALAIVGDMIRSASDVVEQGIMLCSVLDKRCTFSRTKEMFDKAGSKEATTVSEPTEELISAEDVFREMSLVEVPPAPSGGCCKNCGNGCSKKS